jgi:hypothetical protein
MNDLLSEAGTEFITDRIRLFYHNGFRSVMVKAFRNNREITTREIEEIIKSDLETKVEDLRKNSYKWDHFALLLELILAKVDYTKLSQDLHKARESFLAF